MAQITNASFEPADGSDPVAKSDHLKTVIKAASGDIVLVLVNGSVTLPQEGDVTLHQPIAPFAAIAEMSKCRNFTVKAPCAVTARIPDGVLKFIAA